MTNRDFGYKPLPIDLNPNSHRYKLEGIPLIGTTTVLGVRDKPFLMFWTVKEMWKYLTANWDIKKVYTKEEKDDLLMLGKKAWTVKKDMALDAGKIAHKFIQGSIDKNIRYTDYASLTDNTGWSHQIRQEVWNAYSAWLDWEKAHKVEYLATELIVGSKLHYVGGTIDAIAMVDNQLELLDWKTSKQFSSDVHLQLGFYKFMLLEGGVDKSIKRRTVRFDKGGAGFQEILIKSNYEQDVETFLALLKVYRWNRDFKKDYCDKQGKLKVN